jgi:hypothetical protein
MNNNNANFGGQQVTISLMVVNCTCYHRIMIYNKISDSHLAWKITRLVSEMGNSNVVV